METNFGVVVTLLRVTLKGINWSTIGMTPFNLQGGEVALDMEREMTRVEPSTIYSICKSFIAIMLSITYIVVILIIGEKN